MDGHLYLYLIELKLILCDLNKAFGGIVLRKEWVNLRGDGVVWIFT